MPSREQAIGDPEVAGQASWTDTPADTAWTNPPPGDVLRAMDRFHAVPASEQKSWAEWLYFNGKSRDGSLRFYLTFMTGAPEPSGTRPMFVRLQLTRAGEDDELFGDGDGRRARIARARAGPRRRRQSRATGRSALPLHAVARQRVGADERGSGSDRRDRARAPLPIAPCRRPSFTAPTDGCPGTSSRCCRARFTARSASAATTCPSTAPPAITITTGASGKASAGSGDRWLAHDISLVYGRVFPPATVADATRLPGFLAVLGPDGPIAFSTDVSIEEEDREAPHR